VAGSVFLALGWSVPAWAAATLDLMGQIALGATFWLCLVKLLNCVAVPLPAGAAFGLSRLAFAVLVLQSATPVAVTSCMLAEKYDARADELAGLVVVSTLLSVLAIPLLFGAVRLNQRLECRQKFGRMSFERRAERHGEQ